MKTTETESIRHQAKIAAAECPPEGGDELDPLDGIADDEGEEGDDVNAAAPAMAKRIEGKCFRVKTTDCAGGVDGEDHCFTCWPMAVL